VYMKEAVANVMAAARSVGDVTEYGYTPGTCFLAAFIQPRGAVSMNVPMEAGKSYVFLGGGSKDADDVDIEILDSRGKVVAKDDDVDPTPVVRFTPPRAGKYTLRLTLFKADSACFCAVAILQRGGYDIPIRNLADATNDLIGFCNDVWRSGKIRMKFHDSDNQWAIYGSIIKEGTNVSITNLHPGEGTVAVIAAGDGIAEDIDVAVLDENNRVIKEDTRDDASAVVVCHTDADTSYGIRTQLSKSRKKGASFVLTAVLDLSR